MSYRAHFERIPRQYLASLARAKSLAIGVSYNASQQSEGGFRIHAF
jgi:hypothetical protein